MSRPAQAAPAPDWRDYGLHGAEIIDLADATGAVRRILMWTPEGEPPAAGWPALVLLDGNAAFGTAVDAVRAQAGWPEGTNLGWGAVIAIGYPIEGAYDPFRRSWDLGPPPGRAYPPFWEGTPEVRTGGGAEFAAFLLERALPAAAARAPLDPAARTLFGHSFGGLFAMWLLARDPHAFRGWLAASPALSWEDSFAMAHLDRFIAAPPAGLAAEILLIAGEWEGDELAPHKRARPDADALRAAQRALRTVALAEETAARLSTVPGVSARFEIHPDETHMSVLPIAVARAVRLAFRLR